MACELGLEYCTRSCGCANCVHNTTRTPYVVTAEEEKRNKEIIAKHREAENIRRKHFITEILPKSIVPLLDDNDGCGFFVKGYFLTAGHCLESGQIRFRYNQKDYIFTKEDAVYFKTIDKHSTDVQTGDIAIFKFEDATHHLNIGKDLNTLDLLSESGNLILPHFIHKVENNGGTTSIFNDIKESYVLELDKFQYYDSLLEKIEGTNNYVSYMFEASTDAHITGGSSGSPIINRDLEVVGLLIGCRDINNKPNIILFNHLQGYKYMLGLY